MYHYHKIASRLALTGMLALSCLSLQARSQAPSAPSLALNLSDGMTVHQSDGVVKVELTAAAPEGLRSASVSGGYSSATAYPQGAKSCFVRSYFYVRYFPVGDYIFRAAATNFSGVKSSQTIMLHLVK